MSRLSRVFAVTGMVAAFLIANPSGGAMAAPARDVYARDLSTGPPEVLAILVEFNGHQYSAHNFSLVTRDSVEISGKAALFLAYVLVDTDLSTAKSITDVAYLQMPNIVNKNGFLKKEHGYFGDDNRTFSACKQPTLMSQEARIELLALCASGKATPVGGPAYEASAITLIDFRDILNVDISTIRRSKLEAYREEQVRKQYNNQMYQAQPHQSRQHQQSSAQQPALEFERNDDQ